MRSLTEGKEEESVGRKEKEQKREGRGEESKLGWGGKRQAEQQGLALWCAGTLASVQALVCVGRVTIDADWLSHRAADVT